MGQHPHGPQLEPAVTGSTHASAWSRWFARLTGQASGSPALAAERRLNERRTHSFWSFTYGSFRPRRRQGRRQGDHERVFLDWHEPRVLYLVLAVVLMSCTDALFTLNLLASGAQEINAIMNALILHDVETFLAVKIGSTCLSAVLLAVVARRQFMGIFPVVRLLQLFCAGYAALLVYEVWMFVVYF
ncbi:MAG: DUF5658 family protein [Gammaproteobacteria bacterium]